MTDQNISATVARKNFFQILNQCFLENKVFTIDKNGIPLAKIVPNNYISGNSTIIFNDQDNLKDKVVVITGGSEGFGRALAVKLLKKQSKVIILARDQNKLLNIKKKYPQIDYFVCDIRNPDELSITFKKILEKYITIDILINNAGIWLEGETDSHTPTQIKNLFETNTIGTIYATQEVLPIMKKNNSGQILNIISVAGVEPAGNWASYVSSKYAIKGFTDSLKLELEATGIKVMGFYPAGMNTKLFENAGYNYADENWMMDKKEIASIVIFMLEQSDDIVIDHVEVRKKNF